MLLRNYAVESLYIDQCYLSLVLESACSEVCITRQFGQSEYCDKYRLGDEHLWFLTNVWLYLGNEKYACSFCTALTACYIRCIEPLKPMTLNYFEGPYCSFQQYQTCVEIGQ